MSVQRSTSAFALSLKVGLFGSIVAIIAMLIDHVGNNSVAAHATEVYTPHGLDPNSGLIWSILYTVFALTAIAFAVALVGARRERLWARWWGSAAGIVSGLSLAYIAVATEYDSPILPQSWRIVSGALAAVCFVIMVTAWLPSSTKAMR